MTTAERLALNALLANKQFFSAIAAKNTNITTGTPMGIDGATGRTLIIAGDGQTRANSITNSSQLAITSPFVIGNNGNAGFSDGRGA